MRKCPFCLQEIPEEALTSAERLAVIREAVDALPDGQRAVMPLRDLDGLSSEEARNALEKLLGRK